MSRLVLPIAGQASRIGGIPKFILPIKESESLIGTHVRSARDADLDGVVVICRDVHFEMTRNLLAPYGTYIDFVVVKRQTLTMNERFHIFARLTAMIT